MAHIHRMNPTPKLTPHEERRVAVAAGCDPRTVRAYLKGRAQRSTVVSRVHDALVALGFHATPASRTASPAVDGAA